ncbi:hypothetical protein Btru_045234 [Bulinus truncatus]|nr:hypothetical protein Btru_045234 [Bulinus truncatus]
MMIADVILPAAGSSERMKLPIEKQFLQVQGKHIIAYTVDSFHRLPWIRHIVVTVDSAHIEFAKTLMSFYGFDRVIVSAGGFTRHRSISNGVKVLRQLPDFSESTILIIHDAARPLTSEDIIFKVAEAAKVYGAAGVTRPLVSTVIKGDSNHMLVKSLDRRIYQNSEMPQAFRFNIIASAYEKCTEDDFDFGTECLLLALKYSNTPAFLVKGTEDLWKVTYQKDLYSLESVVKAKNTIVSVFNTLKGENVCLSQLYNGLSNKAIQWTEKDRAANTFLFVLDPLKTLQLDELITRVSHQLSKLPYSAVNLRPHLLLIFLFHDSKDCHSEFNAESVAEEETLNCGDLNSTFHVNETNLACSDKLQPEQLMETCLAVIKKIKLILGRESLYAGSIITGIITKVSSLAVDEIVEIISIRSSCLDNQVLSYI